MKILLYSEGKSLFSKSGVGRALHHQMEALNSAGVEFTQNRKDNFDIVHINTIGLESGKTLKKAIKMKKPVVYTTHTTYEDFKNSFMFSNLLAPLIKKRVKKLYSKADRLISPSDYTKSLIESYGVKKEIDVISNGINTVRFYKDKNLAENFKKEYSIDGPVVICVGLPFARKGIFDFCEVAKSLPEYKFIWFGAKITSVLPKAVKNIIKNPPKNVLFPGYVENDIIIGAYSGADLFFFPSYEENEGIVILESLAMECPILIRDIPVYKSWMEEDKVCFKGRDNSEFIKKIKDICEGKVDTEEIVKNGLKVAEERDIKRVGEKLKEIYERALIYR